MRSQSHAEEQRSEGALLGLVLFRQRLTDSQKSQVEEPFWAIVDLLLDYRKEIDGAHPDHDGSAEPVRTG